MIADRIAQVRERIARAAERARRDPGEITLIAVSKVKPAEDIRAAYEAGQRDFGENYLQEFQQKAPLVADLADARFHFIGKLQSNKTRPAAGLFHAIHTVESVKIARRLNDQTERPLDVFLEVKLSDEEAKSGMGPETVGEVAEYVRGCENLRLLGLMTMPPWSEDPEAPRPLFRRLRELAQQHGMRELVEAYQKDLIVHALEVTNGTWSKAAEFLQMDRGNLYRMGKKLGVMVQGK